jgi:WD40 repeat protein
MLGRIAMTSPTSPPRLPSAPSKAPRLPIIAGLLLLIPTIWISIMVFGFLIKADLFRLRGSWVKTHLSEWGTGRGGYFQNEAAADHAILGCMAALLAVLTGLLIWYRPKPRALFHAGLWFLGGWWITGAGVFLLTQSNHRDNGPDYSRPVEARPDGLFGHQGQVTSAAFSPDGSLLISGGEDHRVRLWNVTGNSEIASLSGHEGEVLTVAFSPDGKTIASGSVDKTIRLWDVETRREKAVLRGHQDKVRCVVYSADGSTIASASWDKTVKLWDGNTQALIATLEGHTEAVKAVAFSPDGKQLASGGVDTTVRIWDLATRSTIKIQQGLGAHFKQVLSLAFSPDGRWLASAGESPGVIVWEGPDWGDPVEFHHTDFFWGVAFSRDSGTLVCCDELGQLEVWTVEKPQVWVPSTHGGEAVRWKNGKAEVLFRRHEGCHAPARIYGVAISPDGVTVATAGATQADLRGDGVRVNGGMGPAPPTKEAPLNLWRIKP